MTHDTEVDLTAPVQAVLGLLAYRGRQPTVRRAAALGPVPLTQRELQVLRVLAEGHTARAMARMLGIAPATVRKHLARVYDKLDTHDRMMAVRRGRELGLLDRETGTTPRR